MDYICNPMNFEYKYQFTSLFGKKAITREGADPSMILFKGKYYMFFSMNAGFYVSEDLVHWKHHSLIGVTPIYDYAPDVRAVGDYMYLSASKDPGINSPFFRSKNPVEEPFEQVSCTFSFWDPNLFVDEDESIYFYWGCSNNIPIKGVELNSEDMTPLDEPRELFLNQMERCGYERSGEDHSQEKNGLLEKILGNNPNIEGPWMDKYNGRYYLQYAAPGAQYNVYLDGVYESGSPLGPFVLARNNPYSYKPGGFIPGAGHGSTMRDKYGNLWHTSTMRICVGYMFERRVGLWPAGFDEDGELFCNQRFGDWVMPVPQERFDPFKEPEWMLLSAGKGATASSYQKGKEPGYATKENIQTWWRAAAAGPNEWLKVDLGEVMDVRAVQINFADDHIRAKLPKGEKRHGNIVMKRFIDHRVHCTQWILEISRDDKNYCILEDKSNAKTDLSHDLVIKEEGILARYIRLTVKRLPFNQPAAVSGLRVFGKCNKDAPEKAEAVKAVRLNDFDMKVSFKAGAAMGCNILWGHAREKLYHCYTVYGEEEKVIKALVKDQNYFVRVDTFGEGGITHGEVVEVR